MYHPVGVKCVFEEKGRHIEFLKAILVRNIICNIAFLSSVLRIITKIPRKAQKVRVFPLPPPSQRSIISSADRDNVYFVPQCVLGSLKVMKMLLEVLVK